MEAGAARHRGERGPWPRTEGATAVRAGTDLPGGTAAATYLDEGAASLPVAEEPAGVPTAARGPSPVGQDRAGGVAAGVCGVRFVRFRHLPVERSVGPQCRPPSSTEAQPAVRLGRTVAFSGDGGDAADDRRGIRAGTRPVRAFRTGAVRLSVPDAGVFLPPETGGDAGRGGAGGAVYGAHRGGHGGDPRELFVLVAGFLHVHLPEPGDAEALH